MKYLVQYLTRKISTDSCLDLGSNQYCYTRDLGIGISSAADHEILVISLSNERGVRFEIVRPAPTPRVYASTSLPSTFRAYPKEKPVLLGR